MTITISIRGLVEFILRSGNIDNRIHQVPTDAMQEGSRIHRMIQKSMGPDHHAEVPLKYVHKTDCYDLEIEGRADGILDKYIDDDNAYDAQESFIEKKKPAPLIDEIKGTYRDLKKMKEPVDVHLAQAKCYAAIYSQKKHCPDINVRMSYCNIDTEEMILRKGSIAAHKGEKVLIPINMRDGSVLAVGKGNPEWNYSAPHGAGRLMSRSVAKNTLSLEEYQETMRGVYTTSINENTLDEAPMAYKSLEDIIDVIRESVDVIEVLRPIYNFKASE